MEPSHRAVHQADLQRECALVVGICRYGCCFGAATTPRSPHGSLAALGTTITILVAFASLVLATCAYFQGLWPQRLAINVQGSTG
jgi:hypothetical protein